MLYTESFDDIKTDVSLWYSLFRPNGNNPGWVRVLL